MNAFPLFNYSYLTKQEISSLFSTYQDITEVIFISTLMLPVILLQVLLRRYYNG